MRTEKRQRYFILGIKGVAMANLAILLKQIGHDVYGVDVAEEFITDTLLKKYDIPYSTSFESKIIPEDTDFFVYSAAHNGTDNVLSLEAKKRNIPLVSQTELLDRLMASYKTKIAICGCHGKTTTASLLSYALVRLGKKPGYLVGAPDFDGYDGAMKGLGEYFVVEADEYGIDPPRNRKPKFLKLHPDYVICTNIDFDHPDVYRNLAETKQAFYRFFVHSNHRKKLILNADDSALTQFINELSHSQYVSYGFDKNADYMVSDVEVNATGTSFSLQLDGKALGRFHIALYGDKNVGNASAVIAMLLTLGFKVEKIQDVITGFTGAKRRFEKIFANNDYVLYDDYGHHPREIEATISAARKRFPGRRIIVVFQPHTFSRTQMLLSGFADALSIADRAFILPIFPSARENKSNFSVTSEDIVKQGTADNLEYVKDTHAVIDHLHARLRKGDVIFTMGAGDVYKLKNEILNVIKSQKYDSKFKIDQLLEKIFGKRNIMHNKDLFLYNTLRVHAIAEYFVEAKNRNELIELKKLAARYDIPLHVFGGGSNLAILHRFLPGITVKNVYMSKAILNETEAYVDLSISSGYPVGLLVKETTEAGYGGFEYHKGLPGTVGGALYMNSKWTRPETYFSESLLYAYVVDCSGRVSKKDKSYFEFAYDYSILQKTHELLLETVFRLAKTDRTLLIKKANEAFSYRQKTQPGGSGTTGCFFRNIPKKLQLEKKLPTNSAGYLIDRSGLKGFTIGDYYVSKQHANFVMNKGEGNPDDLKKILRMIKDTVKQKFGIELEEEVVIV